MRLVFKKLQMLNMGSIILFQKLVTKFTTMPLGIFEQLVNVGIGV